MRRRSLPAGLLLFLAAALLTLTGCLKDTCRNTYKIYTPVMKRLSEVRQGIRSDAPQPMEQTGKIYVFGQYIFLNELQKGIHVIDNSVPAAPKNIGFIHIPGNADMAVKGNYLYADSYSDIVVLDISSPTSVTAVRFVDNVLKENRNYWGTATSADNVMVPVSYIEKDTTVDCETYQRWMGCAFCSVNDAGAVLNTGASAPQTGTGGSMASLTIVNNYLYGVSRASLYALDVSNPSQPALSSATNIGWNIETIYPFGNRLFIGSRTGMFIYSLANPASPVMQGQFTHARSCDPVITDGQYAYVTLRSGNTCGGNINQMDVVDISNISAPSLVRTYPQANPHGLAMDGNLLLLCDGAAGLKLFSAADPANMQLLKTVGGLETFDVIAQNGRAIVVAKDGLYQFTYTGTGSLQQISKLSIKR